MLNDVYQAMEGILSSVFDQAQMTLGLDDLTAERPVLLARGAASALTGVLKRLSEFRMARCATREG